MRSRTGYLLLLGGPPISWRTKKQSVVLHSSAEAEYKAMASTVSEIILVRDGSRLLVGSGRQAIFGLDLALNKAIRWLPAQVKVYRQGQGSHVVSTVQAQRPVIRTIRHQVPQSSMFTACGICYVR
nr:putative reverse transcriptase, RNA-dependent DNA polymerase, Gag-polypeptide of LTR copia-type [Tanacetum cinerariifolium]